MAWVRAGGELALATGLHHLFISAANIVNTKMTSMANPRPAPGRPPKGKHDRLFQMRVSEQFLRIVDDWRRTQDDLPSRAEAIRRLVELGSKVKIRSE